MQAIFLDRDGVINRERSDYVKSWEEFEFLPAALPALARLAALDVPLLIVTNQSAVGRGIISRSMLDGIHRRMIQTITAAGGRIDAVFVCPHHPDAGCLCRKPQPGLLLDAAARCGLNLADCLLIGDAITDFQAAAAVGCRSLLVRSGLQGPDLEQRLDAMNIEAPPLLLADLGEAAEWVCRQVT